jgi:oxalate decarboxylase/phosphoglucose isomerase-like protein (cupin superfamily)
MLTVFVEDEHGNREQTRLSEWECIACPPGVIHGYVNDSLEPVYFHADEQLYARRDAHLKAG